MATYANRTDLQNPTNKMAVTAAPGQTYGEAGAQRAAQQAVPMGAPQAPAGPPNIQGLLAQLGGGNAAVAQQPNTPGAVLSLGGRL